MKPYKVGHIVRFNPYSEYLTVAEKKHAKAGTLFTIYEVEVVRYTYDFEEYFYHIKNGRSKFKVLPEYLLPGKAPKFGKRSRRY